VPRRGLILGRPVSGSLSANLNMYRRSTGPLRVIKDADMVLTTCGVDGNNWIDTKVAYIPSTRYIRRGKGVTG
jgi:hypothetical protein